MLLKGIFWTNNKKHGYFKGTVGGYLMYPSAVMFLLFQVVLLKFLTQARQVFQAKPLNVADYIDYGRIDLADYSWFDRLNCHFCAWANGVTHMVSATLDTIGKCNIQALNEAQKKEVARILSRTFTWAKPIGLMSLGFVIAFEMLLGYKRADVIKIKNDLKKKQFGHRLKSDEFRSIYRNAFKLRVLFKAFEIFLSTIESNWCPLLYANKKALLDHQKNFVSTGYDDVVSYIYKTKDHEIAPATVRRMSRSGA